MAPRAPCVTRPCPNPVRSSNSAKAAAKRQHELETRVWQTDQKLIDAQSKLTAVHLELARAKSAAEDMGRELSYHQRLLEREQREKVREPSLIQATDLLSLSQQLYSDSDA